VEIKSNFVPYAKQVEVLESILGSKAKHHVLVSSRQIGKTLMATNLLLYYAINSPGSYNVLVSPIFAQSKKCFLDLAKAAGQNNPLIESTNASELIMQFKNGSVIRMLSGESKQNLRGFTVSGILVIDEAAFLPEELWNEILMPTTVIRGQKVLFISTPNGFNWFKTLYDYGMSSDYPDFKSYRITSLDNPYMNKDILEMAKLTLPEKAYLQEYLGQFTEGGGSVFEFGDCAVLDFYQAGPLPKGIYFAGLDLAIANDYSVLTIFDQDGNVVDFFRENKTSWEQIIDRVAQKIKHWNAYTLVEKNSIGSVVYEQLKKICGPNLVGEFNTTQDSKQDIIEDLKKAFAEHAIRIPTKRLNAQMHIELASFSYKMLPSGRISYQGGSGASDDIVLSLAIAHHCYRTKKTKGTYAVYSGGSSNAKFGEIGKYL
jgi:hypothetical protein